ncbi:E3 SUMO-protein ligase PIAS1-like [Ornithodoros turicata]|uniref:E3 SUMO-protein ligase PIAS1-like n=1 Tax=Ornithodoros turicata TaxID=34597 RepID=UPI00313977F2
MSTPSKRACEGGGVPPFYRAHKILARSILTGSTMLPISQHFVVPKSWSGECVSRAKLILVRVNTAEGSICFRVAINEKPMRWSAKTVNLTPYVQSGVNLLELFYCENIGRRRMDIFVECVERASTAELLHVLPPSKSVMSVEKSKSMISKSIKSSHDHDVAIMTDVVCLNCPLSKARIKVPCRGLLCNHLQCFDGLFYLEKNESACGRAWRCPICSNVVDVSDLLIDQLWITILEQVPSSCTEVELHEDGTWAAVNANDWSVITVEDSPVPLKRRRQDVTIDLTDEVQRDEA